MRFVQRKSFSGISQSFQADIGLQNYEAFLGFTAFNNKKVTGADKIDFIKFREAIADGKELNDELFDEFLPQPKV